MTVTYPMLGDQLVDLRLVELKHELCHVSHVFYDKGRLSGGCVTLSTHMYSSQ